jgi:hypothetical protein
MLWVVFIFYLKSIGYIKCDCILFQCFLLFMLLCKQFCINICINTLGWVVAMAGELNKLSDRKLKGLHGIPASKIEFYADGAGLSAKVTKAGGISWVFTYRLDGQKLHRLTLGATLI